MSVLHRSDIAVSSQAAAGKQQRPDRLEVAQRKQTQDPTIADVCQSVWAVVGMFFLFFFNLPLLTENTSVSCLFASLPAAHRHVLLACCVFRAEFHIKQAKTRPSSL